MTPPAVRIRIVRADQAMECEACHAHIERGDWCATAGEHVVCEACNNRDVEPGSTP